MSTQFKKEFLQKLLNYGSYVGHGDLPCFNPGRGGTLTLRNGRTGISSSRNDCLRASLGITVAQSWYTNRQLCSGPNIGTVDPGIGARD